MLWVGNGFPVHCVFYLHPSNSQLSVTLAVVQATTKCCRRSKSFIRLSVGKCRQLGESIATVQLYKTLGGGILVQYLSKQ